MSQGDKGDYPSHPTNPDAWTLANVDTGAIHESEDPNVLLAAMAVHGGTCRILSAPAWARSLIMDDAESDSPRSDV